MQSKITLEQFNQLVREQLPFAEMMNLQALIINEEYALFCAGCDENALRPGGTVAGPVMMGLADAAFYALVMANVGLVSLAVTTNLSINFLRKPGPGNLYCKAKLLKLGKRLAVCEAVLYTEDMGSEEPVAHATGTYSIPPA